MKHQFSSKESIVHTFFYKQHLFPFFMFSIFVFMFMSGSIYDLSMWYFFQNEEKKRIVFK